MNERIEIDVSQVLAEDIGTGDITAQLLPETLTINAQIITREPMLMCGQDWANAAFRKLDAAIDIQWHIKEASYLSDAQILCSIRGNARAILTAERTALNFLQTLSGTATTVYHYQQQLVNFQVSLLDTRKTIPGLRYAQKYAVLCGGGTNHRMGLYDAFLIKENHISASGSITAAIMRARELYPTHFLEIEVETLAELQEALLQNPDRVLLDNFTLPMMREAVKMNSGSIPLEVSGGVSESNLVEIAKTGIQCISVGALTKNLRAIDLSLRVKEAL